MPIFLLFLPGGILSEVSKKQIKALWTHFWAPIFDFTEKTYFEYLYYYYLF